MSWRKAPYDESFCGKYVFKLDENNFESFLKSKDVVMVMFHENKEAKDKDIFYAAATTTNRHNHAFASVDCTKQKDLCHSQGAFRHTVYKIYIQGRLAETISSHFPKYQTLRQMVEMARVN